MQIVKRQPDRGYLDSWLWVPKTAVNVRATKGALTLVTAADYNGKQEVVELWKEAPHHLLLPRAFWEVGSLMFEVVDCRPATFPRVGFTSKIVLDHRLGSEGTLVPTGAHVQALSLEKLTEAMGGVLQLACGLGKTVIALEHMAREQVPALIVVDNITLLEQWQRSIEHFLTVPGGVGRVAGGVEDWEGHGIVLATYQTLAARADKFSESFKRNFGGVYFDEGHHVSARVYSRAICLFPGKRFSLTATPDRADGQHVIADFHIGRVLHKDLRPTMIPWIIFYWTALQLDLTDPGVAGAVLDKNREVHLSKVKSFFGTWRQRLWLLMQAAIDASTSGRKVLLLSDSVNEIANLLTMWVRGPHADLYSDVPYPSPADVGETLTPLPLRPVQAKRLKKSLEKLWAARSPDPARVQREMPQWQHFLVHRKVEALYTRKQKQFLDEVVEEARNTGASAGIMTFGVSPKVRQEFLDKCPVVFAITKYGKEGLDCDSLDTILVSSLFSDRNPLQQLLGRPTRIKVDKKEPIVVFFVDDVGQCIGMSKKLQKHLRAWPHSEGGPYPYELLNYPKVNTCKTASLKAAFERTNT